MEIKQHVSFVLLVKWRQDDVTCPISLWERQQVHHALQTTLQTPYCSGGTILAIEIKMSIGRTLYNALFRRTSTFVVTIVVGGFIFERVFDEGMDNLWENMNRGVSI